MFFFFKQKTAYEMRISDWSSDVCSSDLPQEPDHADFLIFGEGTAFDLAVNDRTGQEFVGVLFLLGDETAQEFEHAGKRPLHLLEEIGRASCRERACQYV